MSVTVMMSLLSWYSRLVLRKLPMYIDIQQRYPKVTVGRIPRLSQQFPLFICFCMSVMRSRGHVECLRHGVKL